MSTQLIVCPRCGASPSGPADAHGQHTCAYCGSRFQTQYIARPAHVPAPVHAPPPTQPIPAKKSSPTATAFAILGALVVLFAAGGLRAVLRHKAIAGTGNNPPAAATTLTPASEGLLAPALTPEVPASASFEAHSHVSGYQSSFYVLGFVKNTSPFTIDKPKVTVVLLDKSGKELATRDGYTESDALVSQASAPIKILISDPPPHDHLSFEVVAKKASYIPEEAPGLRLEILEAPHQTSGNSWEVSGKVFNGGTLAARFVSIQVLAFDASSHLVGLDSTYADGESVAAGASGRFRAMPLYDAAPHHFKYVVSGRPQK